MVWSLEPEGFGTRNQNDRYQEPERFGTRNQNSSVPGTITVQYQESERFWYPSGYIVNQL